MALANLLQIQRHDDYLVMLKVRFIFLIHTCNNLKTHFLSNYIFIYNF